MQTSGRVLLLDALHIEETYVGLDEGTPNTKYNETLMSSWVKRRVAELFGNRCPVYVVPPISTPAPIDGEVLHDGEEWLPDYSYYARLRSGRLNSGAGWSELVVVSFGVADVNAPLADIVAPGVRELPWDDLARNYDALDL
jgi:hypothetical protein